MHETIDKLADEAFQAGATDLFLCEDQVPRIRVHNDIQVPGGSALSRECMASFWSACHADPETTLEKDTSHVISGGRRLRVNLYKSLGLLSAVLRPIKDVIPSMTELGLPEALLTNWASRQSGLILITGPTGSGKSTTLASALQWVNENQARHIVTIEDPIEYLFWNKLSYFSQRELHADTASFASALRSSLRQSPDIILLGEIRDEETAKISLQAAETGHLVLATLHSSSVADSLERLANLFDHDKRESLLKLLAQHLVGIMSQQLIPRKDGGLLLAVEHLQNEAVTRAWIRENNLPEISDHINRGDNPANCSFVRFLVAATQQGYLDKNIARRSAPNAQDFDRLLRGIT
ncbi:MAG: PilT/PilU family type 4a pilus ATPase [Verrucomicrobiae bacterium]|nr:PilT/PilU family type 4a pilus ATPase [Verrucomicrobiae bacterium]NNJ42212.1 PilT/PilU family type 4a pilus ATPase [Akkermansiaceae bacterium]